MDEGLEICKLSMFSADLALPGVSDSVDKGRYPIAIVRYLSYGVSVRNFGVTHIDVV